MDDKQKKVETKVVWKENVIHKDGEGKGVTYLRDHVVPEHLLKEKHLQKFFIEKDFIIEAAPEEKKEDKKKDKGK